MKRTTKFQASLGVNPGYNHANPNTDVVTIVTEVWQKCAKIVFDLTGIYVSAVIVSSRTVYHRDWGCPEGGEVTALITGEANPEFISNLSDYENAVIQVLNRCSRTLAQTTAQVTFSDTFFHYIKNEL